MHATTEDRALAEQFAGAKPFDLPQVDLGQWSAINWKCHAPTTVVTMVNGKCHVIAECTGNGQHSDDAAVRAAQIAELPNLVRIMNYMVRWHDQLKPSDIAMAKAALAKVGVMA